MQYYPFPALLRCSYNDIREFGQATVAHKDDAIDFAAEFILLAPLDMTASVSWISGRHTLATYEGRVYLSSPSLLRLVGIGGWRLKPLRSLLATNTRLPATVSAAPDGPRKTLPHQAVEILYLSPTHITLLCANPFEDGQALALGTEVDFLTLRGLPLQVARHLPIRRHEHLLLCTVGDTGDENIIALSAYSARLELLDPAERVL
ncbi:MAG: hypothetical protein GXY32_01950 [Ruminococcaceae bacterium]|nr:hypothetical protein [Oscillospiraceae bacterium]